MRRLISFGVLFSMVILWGCGGGSLYLHSNKSEAAVSSDCSPDPVSSGGSVVCLIPSRNADDLSDCTFFVSKKGFRKIPIEADLAEGDDAGTTSVSFQVPLELTGDVDLLVGCGVNFKTLAKLNVSSGYETGTTDEDVIGPAPSGGTMLDGADTMILPSGPATTPVAPAPSTGDSVGTPAVTPTPATPPAPAATPVPAAPVSLTVSISGSLAAHPAQPGAAHLTGQIQGGGTRRAAYIYGPFAPDGHCDQILAIDPSGGDLNPGSPNFIRYQNYVGVTCDATAGNCEGFSATTSDGMPAPINCRIDLDQANGSVDFYFRLSQARSEVVLVATAEDGTLLTGRTTVVAPAAYLSNIQINISQAAPEFVVTYSSANAISAPVVTGCHPTATPSTPGQAHCALEIGANVTVAATGIGGSRATETYRIECADPQVELKRLSFTATAGTSSVTDLCEVSESNWSRTCNAPGELELQGEVYRNCEVKKQASDGSFQTVSSASVPWVGQVKLTEVAGGACTTDNDVWLDVTPDMVHGGRARIVKRLKRTHECTHYAFSVKAEDGHETTQEERAPYQGSFRLLAESSYQFEKLSDVSGPYCPQGYQTSVGSTAPDGGRYCGNSESSRSRYLCRDSSPKGASFKVTWSGRHLKSIRYSCTTSGYGADPANLRGTHLYERNTGREIPIPTTLTEANTTLIQPDAASYDLQAPVDGFVNRDSLMEVTLTCDFTAVTTDDEEIHQSFTWDLGC
jgi:hypothetical protein